MKFVIIILLIITVKVTFAQELVGITMSNCDADSDPEFMHANRLISKSIVNDTLLHEIDLAENQQLYF